MSINEEKRKSRLNLILAQFDYFIIKFEVLLIKVNDAKLAVTVFISLRYVAFYW